MIIMSEKSEIQKIRLGNKHPTVGGTKSQDSDGFVSFSVGSRYKLLETIGTGAYGVVCSAIDTKTNCHVAIKKIVNPFEVLTTAKRTLRELKLLLHFKHDNIVGIKNVIQSDQKNHTDVYLVMDLMESDLHHIIRSEQPLSAEHVCYFLYQLLRGLKYIHSSNVIHRDLKPSNLLVNENCELKIGDFGMARAVSSTPDDHKFFMTEYVATRWYRAPELMLSIGEYSQAIDMWSVGCIFAEMMGRKQIFPGRHYVHQLQLVISILGSPANDLVTSIRSERVRSYVRSLPHREPVKFKTLYPKASEQMLELLQSFLQFDPEKRPTAKQTLNHSFFSGYHDIDDEPTCPLPFDFRFESTVTKEAVRDQATSAIDSYCERKSRLSQQLMMVHGKSSDNPVPSATAAAPTGHSGVQDISHLASEKPPLAAATTTSVFKKPPAPTSTQKVILPKPASQLLTKPSSEDIDMKSANSVCSMDISIELDAKTAKQIRQGAFSEAACSGKPDAKPASLSSHQTPSAAVKPMITVQVVQDSTASLTAIDSVKDDGTKKQSNKQKKENEKGTSKKTSSIAPKKTTISENTKMKIRDSIFANMFAKQKGLGKPLEKVKKSVTAAERQREREEKRKKRQERAAEKERRREESRKKDQLSDADKSLLDRWKKMQEQREEDESTPGATPQENKPERANSSKSIKEGKREGKRVNRHKSLPSSAPRTYQQSQLNTQENRQPVTTSSSGMSNPALFPVQPNNNRLITVLLGGSDKPQGVPQGARESPILAPARKAAESQERLSYSDARNIPLQYIRSVNVHASDVRNQPPSFTNIPFQLQQRPTFSAAQPSGLHSDRGFVLNNSLKDQPAPTSLGADPKISNPAPQPVGGTQNSRPQELYGAEGGVFIPESDGETQDNNRFKSATVQVDESGLLRPTSLFTNENDPKVTVLVGNELMTPGKALQHSSLISTPQGRNLATLSPDTIDFVLNEEFQKRTNIEGGKQASTSGRPASYPSVVPANVQDPLTDNDLRDPLDSSTSRSRSYTYLTSMPDGDVTHAKMTSSSVRQHSKSEPPNVKKRAEAEKTNTGSSTSSLFRHIQEMIDDKKSHSGSSFDFPPGSFIKSLEDPSTTFAVDKMAEPNADIKGGGVFVPHLDTTSTLSVPQYSVAMSDSLLSAGAASAVGYGLGVDISDIIPQSAGEGGSGMEYAASADHSDSSLLADWLNYSCLCPQDMDALQRELELGSPMSVDIP